MKMPDKVYVKKEKNNVVYSLSVQYDNGGEEYIRKDIVDETIKTAEDHAYFAGQEKFREKLIEWANKMLQDTTDCLDFHSNQAFAQLFDKLNSM